jgi:hypothetical protein
MRPDRLILQGIAGKMEWPRYRRRHRPPGAVLPTFIVIGANKGGTTSLSHYLDQHPDVFMSRNKEPMFFSNVSAHEGRPDHSMRSEVVRTWGEYTQLFAAGRDCLAIGEASTSYLCYPGAPARIHAKLPAVRLLAVLRNPFDRAFSAFQMYQRLGMETLSFAEAIDAELARFDGLPPKGQEWKRMYLQLGFYGRGLTRYLEYFPGDQLGIHLFEDLEAAPRELIHNLFRFIGVDPSFCPDIDTKHNAAPTREGPEWDRSLHDRFLEYIEPDIKIVEQLVGRDLQSWRHPTPLRASGAE